MTLVLDASVVAAALIDPGQVGEWALTLLPGASLAAPHLMPVEVASILRRNEAAGHLSADLTALAHAELRTLPVDLAPYGPFASRVWELRGSVTTYDAWYVALAESLDAPLATLDERLTRAPGPRCRYLTPRDPS